MITLKLTLHIAIIVAMGFPLAGCVTHPPTGTDANVRVVTASAAPVSSDQVSLAPGEVLRVRLPRTTAGATSWRMTSQDRGGSVIKFQSRMTEQPQIGRYWNDRAHEVFTFLAVAPGESTLRFVSDQAMNSAAGIAQTFTVQVSVSATEPVSPGGS